MADEWDRLFETFERPWKIKRHTSGNYYIQDKQGRVICWVYPKGTDTADHKKPSEEEALTIVKAIAKMSKAEIRPHDSASLMYVFVLRLTLGELSFAPGLRR